MGLPDLYPAQVGSPYTTLAAPYTSGESTMTLVDATKLPTAPNIVCLAGDVAGEFSYTGKEGNVLQGVTALPGTPAATTWPAGTFAFRGISAYDLNAIHENMVRTATYVVAASDAPAHVKRQADYVCDGTDDQVEIQAAIDALPLDGGSVHLTVGEFSASGITLRSNVSLSGEGAATVLTCPASTSENVIQAVTQSTGILIADLLVDGNATNNTNQSNDAIQNGIYLYNCGYWSIRNVHAQNCIQAGIVAKGTTGTGNYYFQHSTISRCYTSGNRVAGYALLDRAEYITIEGCHAKSENYGMYIVAGNNTVSGSHITYCARAMYLYPGSNSHGVQIVGNQINHNQRGIHITGPCANHSIVGNHFVANTSYCLYLFAIQDCLIAANYFGANLSDIEIASYLGNASFGNRIEANIFGAGTTAYGVAEMDATCHDNIVEGNSFAARTTAMVSLQGAGSVARMNAGHITEASGAAASTADGGTIAHGCAKAPTAATVSGSVAGEIVTVTSIDATNITVAIKKSDGSAGTSQTIYWRAEV